jgi:hypothetical protein
MVCVLYGRGRPLNAPAAFIHPCQPIVAKRPPSALSALAFDILMHTTATTFADSRLQNDGRVYGSDL